MSIYRIFSLPNVVIGRALHFLNENAQPGNWSKDFEHDEIHQTFKLTHEDLVEVTGVCGPIEVETIDGDVAEVHIIRSAKIKADLAWRKFRIEQMPTGLIIESEDEPNCPHSVRVDHYVLLKLPRQTNFYSDGVSGSISVEAIDGTVQISGCSGSVIMKETNGPTEISGVSGSVILRVTRLSERGLRVNGISGTVELYLSDKLDAELSIMNYSGRVFINIPLPEPLRSGHHYRLGQGGPRISVNGVSGNVVVRPG